MSKKSSRRPSRNANKNMRVITTPPASVQPTEAQIAEQDQRIQAALAEAKRNLPPELATMPNSKKIEWARDQLLAFARQQIINLQAQLFVDLEEVAKGEKLHEIAFHRAVAIHDHLKTYTEYEQKLRAVYVDIGLLSAEDHDVILTHTIHVED